MRSALAITLLLVATTTAKTRTFTRSADEIEIFAAVLRSEIAENHWSNEDRICLSIHFSSPGKDDIRMLRSNGLNVYPDSDWPKKVSCSYAVRLEPARFLPIGAAQVKFETSDLRGINNGTDHFALRIRQGMYRLLKTRKGHWSVTSFATESNAIHNDQR